MLNLKSITHKLHSLHKKAYIVGWFTREKILWLKYSWDIDLATDATPDEMEAVLKVIKEVWKKYWTLIIKEWNETFEITTFRKDIWILDNRKPVNVEFTDSLEMDSQRRDFTFNAIYYDIENETYLDPQNGIADIKNKIIRFIWNPNDRINEDALRILRYIRFKNKYSLNNFDKWIFKVLKNSINLLKNISVERIKEEIDKILLLENNIQALKDLKEIWFFEEFLPEVDKIEQTPWGPWHHLEWNVWIHTLMTIKELNSIFLNWLELCDNRWNELVITYTSQEKLDFYWTLLLHDISKHETYSIDEKWLVHYYDHEKLWAEKVKNILNDFKFSKKSTMKIIWLIENHLKVFKVFDMRILKARKLMMHKYFKDLIVVWIADHLWRIPTDENLVTKLKEFYKEFMVILSFKRFYTWDYILSKYPELKWIEIKNRLNALNDEILIK